MIVKDRVRTMEQQYLDKRSYMTMDGREILYGEDWRARKAELRFRAGGICEYFMCCSAEGTEPHHLIRRSKGRDDRLKNLVLLCHYHHALIEKEGPNRRPRWTKGSKQTGF